MSLCKNPLKVISQFATALCSAHGPKLYWFSKPDVWGPHLSGAGLKVGVPHVGYESFTPQGGALGMWVPCWLWVTELGVAFTVKLCPSLSYLPQCDPFLLCWCEGAALVVFRSFSEKIVSYVACWFRVSMRNFRIFLHHQLGLLLDLPFLKILSAELTLEQHGFELHRSS